MNDVTNARYAPDSTLTPVDAVVSAAGFLSREWGEYGRRLATTKHTICVKAGGQTHVFWVFLCSHTDGCRWWIATTRYGITAHSGHRTSEDMGALEVACRVAVAENDRKLDGMGRS